MSLPLCGVQKCCGPTCDIRTTEGDSQNVDQWAILTARKNWLALVASVSFSQSNLPLCPSSVTHLLKCKSVDSDSMTLERYNTTDGIFSEVVIRPRVVSGGTQWWTSSFRAWSGSQTLFELSSTEQVTRSIAGGQGKGWQIDSGGSCANKCQDVLSLSFSTIPVSIGRKTNRPAPSGSFTASMGPTNGIARVACKGDKPCATGKFVGGVFVWDCERQACDGSESLSYSGLVSLSTTQLIDNTSINGSVFMPSYFFQSGDLNFTGGGAVQWFSIGSIYVDSQAYSGSCSKTLYQCGNSGVFGGLGCVYSSYSWPNVNAAPYALSSSNTPWWESKSHTIPTTDGSGPSGNLNLNQSISFNVSASP